MSIPTDPPPPTDPGARPVSTEGSAADHRTATIARVVVVASLVLTLLGVVLVGVVAVPRYAAVADGGVPVPATLLLGPDRDGCLELVGGDGRSRARHCDQDLAHVRAWHVGGTSVAVEDWDRDALATFEVDLATGRRGPAGPDVVAAGPPEPGDPLDVDGTTVRDLDGTVLLELDGRSGPRAREAVAGPDGRWLVVQDGYGRVLVAGPDGAVRSWVHTPDDSWLDLATAVSWQR